MDSYQTEKSVEGTLLRQLHLCGHIISHHTEESSSQRRLLSIIKKLGLSTQRELVDKMGIRPPSLSALVVKLEAKGFITRVKDEQDRRNFNISITEEGEEALNKMQEEHEQILQNLFSALTEEERLEASQLLQKLLISWEPRHRELKKKYDPYKLRDIDTGSRGDEE